MIQEMVDNYMTPLNDLTYTFVFLQLKLVFPTHDVISKNGLYDYINIKKHEFNQIMTYNAS